MGGGEDKIDLPCFSLTLSQVVITHLHNIVPHVVSYGPPAISVKWLLLLPFSSGVLRLISYKVIDLVAGMSCRHQRTPLIPAPPECGPPMPMPL